MKLLAIKALKCACTYHRENGNNWKYKNKSVFKHIFYFYITDKLELFWFKNQN